MQVRLPRRWMLSTTACFVVLTLGCWNAAQAVMIRAVELEGATVLSNEEIRDLESRYTGRDVQMEDLASLLAEVNALYRDKGYVTSGARLPEQNLESGVIRVAVTEGRLGQVNIETVGRIAGAPIENLLLREVEGPLNISDLQAAFNRLESAEHIRRLSGNLVASDVHGETALDLTVEAADAFELSVAFNNYRSPSVGEAQVGLVHRSLSGRGDRLDISLAKTEGVDSGMFSYNLPFASAWAVGVHYSVGDTVVVEAPFDAIDIASEIDTGGFTLSYAPRQSATGRLALTMGYEQKSSKTSLLGQRFDFGQGSVNGVSDAAIVHLSAEWSRRSRSSALSARLGYRRGVDAGGATIQAGGLPDGRFDSWVAQLRYAHRFDRGDAPHWLLSVALDGQYTSDVLQAFERLALGGRSSVRGFRENQVLRDRGVQLRLALDVPLVATDKGLRFVLIPFIDAGEGSNSTSRRNETRSLRLASAGLGLRLQTGGLQFDLEWADTVTGERGRDGDALQDDGVHLGMRYVF